MALVPSINQAVVGNYTIFYREAGPPSAPTILLLHGFPSSSHQYRNLIPILALFYHVIAPDFPGFGFTSTPSSFPHTFANIATVMSGFLDVIGVKKFAMYIFDYGAPVGLRLALERESDVLAIVSQSGNAYMEGLGAFWDQFKPYWETGSEADRDALRPLLTFNVTESQYTTGAADPSALAPETWWLDWTLINNQPGNTDYQLDLFYDYRNNVAQYPQYQEYFRKSQVPLLAVWGKNDMIFVPPGAEAFLRDLPKAEVHLIDAGHFALESSLVEIVGYVMPFLRKNIGNWKKR